MAILSKTGFYGAIESVKSTGERVLNRLGALVPQFASTFVSGFAGKGWAIRNTATEGENWQAEFDTLVVRKTMTIFELLISRIRAINGGLVISQANGKVKSVRSDDMISGVHYLRLEDDVCEFVQNDFIRMQVFREDRQRYYHLRVLAVLEQTDDDGKYYELKVGIPMGSPMDAPQAGDEIVQFGHSTDPNRQSAIYLHADGTNKAAIDLLDGISSANATSDVASGWVVLRIGGDLPNTNSKNGFYCQNGTIFSEDTQGNKVYELRPNGSGQLANGAVEWDAEGNLTFASNVKLTWQNLSTDVQNGITPSIQYSATGNPNEWRNYYVAGDTYMRIGYAPNWQEMRLNQSGDNAYVHVRYGYEIPPPDPISAPMMYMLPINPTSAQMAQATHIGIRTDNSPNYPNPDAAINYTWSKFKGEDANLLPWVEEWNGATTQIGSEAVISPKMFSGSKDANTGALTGIAMGRGVIGYEWNNGVPQYSTDATPRDGIVGIKDNEIYLAIDPTDNNFRNYFRGTIFADSGYFNGRINATEGNVGGYEIRPEGLYKADENASVSLYYSGIKFTDTEGREARYGSSILPLTAGYNAMAYLKDADSHDKRVLMIDARGSGRTLTYNNIGNCAIDLQGGYVRGYCASLKVLETNNETIPRGINVVVIASNVVQSVTLPTLSGAQDDGYLITISNHTTRADITIKGNNNSTVHEFRYRYAKSVTLIWSFTEQAWYVIGTGYQPTISD